jgi:hypothetical protein
LIVLTIEPIAFKIVGKFRAGKRRVEAVSSAQMAFETFRQPGANIHPFVTVDIKKDYRPPTTLRLPAPRN